MNRIYRIVWSRARRAWVVASELSRSRGKNSRSRNGVVATVLASPLLSVFAALMVGLAACPADAADLYWDVDGGGINLGGTGTWNLTSPFWNTTGNAAAGPFTTWDNGALDNAIFGGTGGTVTLGSPITAGGLTFNVGGYTLSGDVLTLGGMTPTITSSGTNTINAVIAGSSGLIKAGGGTLVLNGINTFTGDINLNSGAINAGSDAALGAASNSVFTGAGASVTVSIAGANTNRTITIGDGGTLTVAGSGAGSALITGNGGVSVGRSVTMSNDASTYTGRTTFYGVNGVATNWFTSIGNLGEASSLGAPTTVADGTIVFNQSSQYSDNLIYIGDGDSSNRNWDLNGGAAIIRNQGTGTLSITGDIDTSGGSGFYAEDADIELLGTLSGGIYNFGGSAGRTITLGGANTYTGGTNIGTITVRASTLAAIGTGSSFGAGSGLISIASNGTLSYTGSGGSSNRQWTVGSGSILNDGGGALTLSGTVDLGTAANDGLTLGGSFAGINTLSGVVSGTGDIMSEGAGTWVLSGANTRTGAIVVDGGTLRAGNASAFGTLTGVTVDNGTLDLGGFDLVAPTLEGAGGAIALGAGTLTVDTTDDTSYAGGITGSGGLAKAGVGTLTLSGTNTYTGDTTLGGGGLVLDYSASGAPAGNIIAAASTLNMAGSKLNVIGADGGVNSQTFDGLNISAGSNQIAATSGTGGTMTVNFGAITRTGGLIGFALPTGGNFTTTSTSLGGWATVNGTDYAKVDGGNIVAFTAADYTNKDDAADWLTGEVISDVGDAADTPFFGTVNGSQQLGGLKYTAAADSTVTIGAGETLGVDGTIIVASSVGTANQTITGGSLTGGAGGSALSVLQNGGARFTIGSTIVDNGGATGFTKGGDGIVRLAGTNTYTGVTTLSGGELQFASLADAGLASSLGAASADSSNLVLESGTLHYVGGTDDSTNRGFTLVNGGASEPMVVVDGGRTVEFSGLVTSPDDAGLTKTGWGTLVLSNAANDYVGVTTIRGGGGSDFSTISVNTLADGGVASGIGAAGSDSANLVLSDGGQLQYTGGTVDIDRGFTLASGSGRIDVAQAATTLTIEGTAVGVGGLVKEGAGTLVLTGLNTYTGNTTVNEGTLLAGSEQAFGNQTTSMTVTTGATLDLGGFAIRVGALSDGSLGGGSVSLGAATLTVGSTNGTFSGVISGSGGLTKLGGGTQVMSGCNNTNSGVTTLGGGTLSVDCLADGGAASGIGASGPDSANLAFTGGRLTYTGASTSIDRGFTLQSGDGYINVDDADTVLEFEGAVVGGRRLRKEGDGVLLLSGTNTYTGDTIISGGVLRAGSSDALGSRGFSLADVAGAALDLDGFDSTIGFLSAGGTTGGNVTLGAAALTLNWGSGSADFAGAISGSGDLIKNGNLVQTLSGCSSSYTGSTTINAGRLDVACLADGASNSSIGAADASAGNLVINGGALRYIGAGDSTNRQFTLGGSAALYADGTGAIEFTSTAPITLSGVANRILMLRGSSADDNTLAAQITNGASGVTSLTKLDAGTWVLTNPNSDYTGITTISGGVLGVDKLADGGQASSIGMSSSAASNLVIGSGSTLRYTGAGDSTDRLFSLSTGITAIESAGVGAIEFTNTGTVAMPGSGSRTLALGGDNTNLNIMGGTIANPSGGVATLAKNGPGIWVLTGNNTFTGNTVINDGNLVIGNGGTTGNAGAGNVIVDSATSTLSINRSDTFDFDGTLSGPGTLAQIGAGTTRLTAAANSIGATTVSAGVLQVAAGSGLTTDTVAMNGASTLDVDGTLDTGSISMTDGTTLNVDGTVQAPGGAPVVLTGSAGINTVLVNAGATLKATGDLGDGDDVVTVAGMLDTGAGVLSLGNGDDTLTLRDGAQLSSIDGLDGIDGGAGGNDVLVLDNAAVLTYDGNLTGGFETLIKQNSGTAVMVGAQMVSAGTRIDSGTLILQTLQTPEIAMADDTTLVVDGAVYVFGPLPTEITGSAGVNTVVVNPAATLYATGDLGAGNDQVFLMGRLATFTDGLSLGDGDDTLTLFDGSQIDGSGVDASTGANDGLVLSNQFALTFDGETTSGFERLTKQNTGTATMTGTQTFVATTIQAGTLDVDGTLETASVDLADGARLTVDGTVQGNGGTQAAFTGSAGASTVVVNAGANLLATGTLGDGADTLDVAGTLDTGGGTFSLGDGDDVFVVHDGTHVIGTIDGGGGLDTRVYNINLSADIGAMTGFEAMTKTGTGTLNINGPAASSLAEIEVLGGTLNVAAAGIINDAASTTVASGAMLQVDGVYTGTAGDDTFTVAGTVSGGNIDLGDGDDVLDVAGTLDTGAGAFLLGAGNDTFIVHDTTQIIGTLDAGAGNDMLNVNISTGNTAQFDNMTGFESLGKSGLGGLEILGLSDFVDVQVQAGLLDVTATGGVETQTATVSSGATLNVDGTFVFTPGADQFTVAGTVTGTGTIDMLDGDDVLRLQDGAVLAAAVDGGGVGTDTVALDTASASTFDLTNAVGFERLVKENTGTATMTGLQTFTGGAAVDAGVLDVAGTLDTPTIDLTGGATLAVTGTVQATGATQTTITGDAGINTVAVEAGGTLLAAGDLGGGADVLDVAGTLDAGGGAFNLGAGDDSFVIHDGTVVNGMVVGGDGLDTRIYDLIGAASVDALQEFEGLTKRNTGTLTLSGPGITTDLESIAVEGGILDIAGPATVTGVSTTTVAAGATLNVDGELLFTADADTFTVAGTVTGTGAIELLDGDDHLTLLDGADLGGFPASLDGGAGTDTLTVDITSTATLGGVTGFETLTKQGVGALDMAAPATSVFETVLVEGGVLDVKSGATLGAQTATVETGTTLNVDGDFQFTAGTDSFTVAGAVTGLGTIDMLDGDDQLTILDGADLSGLATALEGGAGTDTLTALINLEATLGGATGFELLVKQGGGSLTIAGPVPSAFDTVLVQEGELNVAAGATVDPQTTVVDAGATMTVDGAYLGTADADTFTLSGTLAGAGTIDLLDGDDTLTINTGAQMAFTGVFDASTASADRFVLAGADTDTFDVSLIDTVFQNFDFFHKEGVGTWRLTGAGDRDWTVSAGTLIGDSTSLGGDIANDATVVFDQAADGAYAGILSGGGTLIKANAGRLATTGAHTFTGLTDVVAGTLQVDGNLPGTMTIGSGAAVTGIGIVGSVTTAAGASIAPGNEAVPFGTLTVAGDYAGGGTISINTVLGDETSATSRLVIQGNTTGASSRVLVNRAGGDGARTSGDGIQIIQVDGDSPVDSFHLAQPVQAGAYEYLLYQGGGSDENDWYLRSDLMNPEVPVEPEPPPAFRPGVAGYALGHQLDLEYGFTALGNLRARVGDQGRRRNAEHGRPADAWMRMYAHELDVTGSRFEGRDVAMTSLQFGTDIHRRDAGNAGDAGVHLGVMASVGEMRATFVDPDRAAAGLSTMAGVVETDVKGAGMYWTRHADSGAYVDISGQILHYRSRYRDQFLSMSRQSGWGGTVAAEIGAPYALGASAWNIEPQAQLAYQRLELDTFTDDVSDVGAVEAEGLRSRVSVQLFRTPSEWLGMKEASPYVEFGVQHDFRDAEAIAVGATSIRDHIPDTTADLSVGFTGHLNSNLELHLDVRYQEATDDKRKDGVRANFGFRMRF